MTRPAAVVLAAGLSSRMARFKPLLPLGERTVLSHCLRCLNANRVEPVIVVTGKRGGEVDAAARLAGAEPVRNAEYEQGMFSSVRTGVAALPEEAEAFFVLPVDIPLVRAETVARLVESYGRARPAVLYPRFRGERGHPPLLDRSLIPDILAHDGEGGLRRVLERREADAMDLDVADFGTVHDLDTPEDYELARALVDLDYPLEPECEQLYEMFAVPSEVVAHCRAVARVAGALCDRLNLRPGAHPLNPAKIRGAALTHDIGKGGRHHEKVGAQRLKESGFPFAAEVALEHFDMALPPDRPVNEKAVVFLADKLVKGESFIPLADRYREKLRLFGHEPEARRAIAGRLERAEAMLARFGLELGAPAEDVAREALA
ncbi:DVU_1551 family NTP transferase [Pseudodesulfovibrio sp.]|uniref:DVU_1551 family NTP transferase n=1 Tax=Pseudodesulfovibrio sp. TaxID=2035812 RepID=UPI00260DB5BA|nr:NTP transferase domain-containing protein [Pseudodesulfovibrio sp.]MDD3312769.1 NTP transferase domain-containing protein [Pseudodesulfovibrio sp.]